MQFGVTGFYEALPPWLDWLETVEALGFDLVGYGDTQMLAPDLLVGLTAGALRTRRLRLGSTVANPVTRHPAVMASALAGIQTLAGGRLFFGLGTGDSALLTIGERPARVADLAAYGQAVRGLCAGETVTWRGQSLQLRWPVAPVPLWLSAEGPRTLQLAGQIADGVIFANGISREVIEDNLRRVRAGAVAAGRDPAKIETWFLVKVYFAADEATAWRELAWTLAASAHHSFRFTLEGKHVPPALVPAVQRLVAGYSAHDHNRPDHGPHNARLVIENGLTEFLGRRFLIAGPPVHIIERLREIAGYGATNLIFPAIYPDKLGYVRRLATEVLPALRSVSC